MTPDELMKYNTKYENKINDMEKMINQQIAEIKAKNEKSMNTSTLIDIMSLIVLTLGLEAVCTVSVSSSLE